MLRDNSLLIVHVGDVMFCLDGTTYGQDVAEKLRARFPSFGTWVAVAQQASGLAYCGKETKVVHQQDGAYVQLGQDGFIDGRR